MTGDLNLTGSGAEVLTGTNTHMGATNLISGLLTTTSSTITVASGASPGTIAPITRCITGAANNTFTADIGDSFRVVTTANQ
ncbi:hypothetical protein OAD42_05530, partial [Oceanospirillaceae bacterium]|nr:hypothetical protein [Oceanospirillaceae bacterium]